MGHECAHSLQVIRQLPRLRMCSITTGIPHSLGRGTSVPEVGVSHPPLPGSHHRVQLSFTQTYTCAHNVRTYIPYYTSVLTRSHRSQPAETDSHSQLRAQPYQTVKLQRTTAATSLVFLVTEINSASLGKPLAQVCIS